MRRGALLLALLLAACSQGVVTEQDGEGALFSTKGTSWGVWQGGRHADVGQVWSFGGVMLCRSAPEDRTSLRSLEPASVEGQVRVEPIAIRTVLKPPQGDPDPDPDVYFVGAMRGAPRNLHKPDGWVVQNTCEGERVSEIVITMAKSGPEGGGISGISVSYIWNDRLHEFVIPVTFGICGTATQDHCWEGVTEPPTTATATGSA